VPSPVTELPINILALVVPDLAKRPQKVDSKEGTFPILLSSFE
jgi:hypothetical protein